MKSIYLKQREREFFLLAIIDIILGILPLIIKIIGTYEQTVCHWVT
jgi:hypothetical protein